MPVFTDEKTGVAVDLDGDGGLTITLPKRKPFALAPDIAKSLSEQIGYAREYADLYQRQPR